MTDTKKLRLFSYKLTHDSGFAPNPFHDVLTLATCKPGMRRTKKLGDWVAGFSSLSLSQSARRVGVKIDRDALIYFGQISEIKTLGSYYDDPQFSKKTPPAGCTSNSVECAGDNIYRATSDDYGNLSAYEQMSFLHHGCDLKNNDLSGKNALIFGEFFI